MSKEADYAIVLLSRFVGEGVAEVWTARELAEEAGLPLPTVKKILKRLARGGVLESLRGVQGGYRMAQSDAELTVAQIVEALEGPIGVVDCSVGTARECSHEPTCPIKAPLRRLDSILRDTLAGLTLRELVSSG